MKPALIALLALGAGVSPGADEHVLAGARLFRADRYAEALVEFRVAERLGSSEAAGYAAAALVKLGRSEEAVEAFAALEPIAAGRRDALLDFYHAVACNEARLYLCADRLLAGVGARAGPRIGEHARKMRAAIEGLLASEPSQDALDWYLARCDAARRGGHALLARAYCEEAAGLASRRRDGYRRSEALASLANLQRETGARPAGR